MGNDNLIIDCFAGGGGASVGIEMALGRCVDIAVNHDPQAIRMHTVNHPKTLHLTEDIFEVDLKKHVGSRHVALMWASPDCTQFSKAKGGKPRVSGIRMLPWAVYKHAEAVKPDVIIMENVEEIQQWGPLDENGRPIKDRMGEEYDRFIEAVKSLGYAFDSRELIAADYGAPTTRKRWYAVFRRDGRPIIWPQQSHFRDRDPRWKPCGDYIDWSDLGQSIFNRKRPLAEATQRRIANGIRKYILENPDPYVVKDEKALAFLIQYHGEQKDGDSRGQVLTEPIRTIDTSNRYGLVTAFLLKYYGTGGGQPLSDPLATITTKDRFGLLSAVLDVNGQEYAISDMFLRMLKPSELKVMQGFPDDYVIGYDIGWKKMPISEQVAKIGNSVSPPVARALVAANCAYLREGDRMPAVDFGRLEKAV